MIRLLIAIAFSVCIARAQITLASSTMAAPAGTTQQNITMGSSAVAVAGQVALAGIEVMGIVSVNGRSLTVTRGSNGTTAAAHVLGTTLWLGPLNAFVTMDPSGACVRSSLPYVPVVSFSTGNAYDCVGSVYVLVSSPSLILQIPGGGTGTNGTTPPLTALGCVSVNAAGTALTTLTATPCGGGAAAFSSISTGVNTSATMTVGSGASLITTNGIFRLPNGMTLPATCTAGDIFDDIDAATQRKIYLCETTNTWVPQGAAPPFSDVTTGTNTTAAMVVGSGSTLGTSGSGIINANQIGALTGVVKAASGTPSVVTGTSTNCVLVDGTSAPCASSAAFSGITSGTNTTATMTVGAGASLIATAGVVRVPNSTTLPATCTVGDVYDDVDAGFSLHLYLCELTDMWVAVGSGSGSAFNAITSGTNTTATMTVGAGSSLITTNGIVRVPNSTTLPAVCTVGDIYDDVDAGFALHLYLCETTNTWVAVGTFQGVRTTGTVSGAITLTRTATVQTFSLTLTGDVSGITLSGFASGDTGILKFTQDSTPRTVTYGSTVVGGSQPCTESGSTVSMPFFYNGTALVITSTGYTGCAPAFISSAGNVINVPDVNGSTLVNLASAQALTTKSLGSGTTLLNMLPVTAVVAPSTPSAGIGNVYVDSTSKNLAVKDDAGVVKHGVQDASCSAGNSISAISAAGLSTCSSNGSVSVATGSSMITPANLPIFYASQFGGVTMVAGTTYCSNVVVNTGQATTKVTIFATTAASGGNGLAIAYFDSTWARVAQLSTATAAAGLNTYNLSYTFTQGLYRLCIASEGGTLSPRAINDGDASMAFYNAGQTMFWTKTGVTSGTGVTFAIDATIATPSAYGSGGVPGIYVQ